MGTMLLHDTDTLSHIRKALHVVCLFRSDTLRANYGRRAFDQMASRLRIDVMHDIDGKLGFSPPVARSGLPHAKASSGAAAFDDKFRSSPMTSRRVLGQPFDR